MQWRCLKPASRVNVSIKAGTNRRRIADLRCFPVCSRLYLVSLTACPPVIHRLKLQCSGIRNALLTILSRNGTVAASCLLPVWQKVAEQSVVGMRGVPIRRFPFVVRPFSSEHPMDSRANFDMGLDIVPELRSKILRAQFPGILR